MNDVIAVDDVRNHMVMVRGQASLLDKDVATLYGVEIKAINQAVKNNPDKFPAGYVLSLEPNEVEVLWSKILTIKKSSSGYHSKYGYKVFTEKGLYMLATILRGKRAVRTTIRIIETYAQLRSMVTDIESYVLGRP